MNLFGSSSVIPSFVMVTSSVEVVKITTDNHQEIILGGYRLNLMK